MEKLTWATRREAWQLVRLQEREKQIVQILLDFGPLTARGVAEEMYRQKMIPVPDRNFAAPRLTELEYQQVVEVVGRQKDPATNRSAAVYALNREVD